MGVVDDPSLAVLSALTAAAFLAGLIDAIVGGGGLVQLPALLLAFPHSAPVYLLATNKMASICGTSTSAVTYLRRIRPDPRTAILLAVAAFAGAYGGALVATRIPKAAFTPIILVVLIAVGLYTLLTPQLGATTNLRYDGRRHLGLTVLIGLAIGFYDGALGPGTGSFFVISLVAAAGYNFLDASAKAKIANFATNLAALAVFIPMGAVLWKVGLVMGVANVAGGYLGARVAVAKGAGFVRIVFIVVVTAFIVRLGSDVVGSILGAAG